jgi:hypothetical protein
MVTVEDGEIALFDWGVGDASVCPQVGSDLSPEWAIRWVSRCVSARMGALGRGLCPIGIPEALDLEKVAVRVICKEMVNPVFGIVPGRAIGISSS